MAFINDTGIKSNNTKMTKFIALDVCRLCLENAEELGDLTDRLIRIISTCFSLKVYLSPDLTNKICQVCVDQLASVYKYRKKIIRSENKLLKILRENVAKYPAKVHPKNSLIDVVKDNKVKVNDTELHLGNDDEEANFNNSDINSSDIDEVNSEFEKEDKDTLLKHDNGIEKTEIGLNRHLKADKMITDFNTDNRTEIIKNTDDNDRQEVNHLTTDEINNRINNLDDFHDHEFELDNPDTIKKENSEDVIVNEDILLETETTLHPIKLESGSHDSTLDTDKENTNMNNLNPHYTAKDELVFEKDENKGETVNQVLVNAIYMDRKHMCLTCLKVFESQKELSIHYKVVELPNAIKENSKKCSDLNIVKVSKIEGEKPSFQCGICSKVFESKTSVVKHLQVHNSERPFLCNLCGRTYKTIDDILRHGVVHNGNKFVCSYDCGYTTVHLGALREHVKRHKKEFKYKCDKCDKCFQVKTWYDQHQNVHDKVRPFVCKICGQAFSMARYLTSHRANVHPQSSRVKRYKCVHCGLPCDSRKSLVMHMKQMHGMKTDCLCDVCGQVFADQHKLSLHKNVHQAIRKYSCRFCKKTFNKKDHKTVHEKIHTGERLNCNNCPKSFTQRCSLRRHIKRYHPVDQQSLEQKS